MKIQRFRATKAIALAEFLVVIAILALMVGIGISVVSNIRECNRKAKAEATEKAR